MRHATCSNGDWDCNWYWDWQAAYLVAGMTGSRDRINIASCAGGQQCVCECVADVCCSCMCCSCVCCCCWCCLRKCLSRNQRLAAMICLLLLMECFCLACDYILTAAAASTSTATTSRVHIERERARAPERDRRINNGAAAFHQ